MYNNKMSFHALYYAILMTTNFLGRLQQPE